jgi:isoleucyl-tRNA synthetase
MNVLKELKKEKKDFDTLTLRKKCGEYARQWVEIQRDEFIRLGIWGEWDNPYMTMSPDYEKTVLQTFGEVVDKGFIYRGKRPIHWCAKCETALAESEIEYKEKDSISILLRFPLLRDPEGIFPGKTDGYILIWTTTPWTIPANQAVVVHPEFDYAIVEVNGDSYLMAARLAPVILESIGITNYKVFKTFKGSELKGLVFSHPTFDRESPLFMADHVTLEEGTGVVHTAPGHGMEDFYVGKAEGLDILCPVNEQGVFTHEGGRYEGLHVEDANPEVLKDLESEGALLEQNVIQHSYPHCWRCKKPLLFRTTTQWFLSVDHGGLREKTLEAIETVRWSPGSSQNRILGMIQNRPDWCLSRQREWGVGIPVLICNKCNEPLLRKDVVDMVADKVGEFGSDCWFSLAAEEFLPSGVSCESCKSSDFRKETDILDVWFESGSSHLAVLENNSHLRWPSDIYLEGTDQHRGWFNTSLIVSMASRGIPPYGWVLTNGWTLDSQGKAMHKLEGNVVSPLDIIETKGADLLRLWVSSNDIKNDVRFSEDTLNQVAETYRRIRNTCRFLLGNIFDYDNSVERIEYEDLIEIDRFALHVMERFKRKIHSAYENMEFHAAYQRINSFCTTISSFYLDVLKDRLYTFSSDSMERKSAQTVLYEMIHTLVRITAPILPFTSEEIWDYLSEDKGSSIHFLTFKDFNEKYLCPDLESKWKKLMALRGEVQKDLEVARAKGEFGSSLEAAVELMAGQEEWEKLIKENIDNLPALFIVSQTCLREEEGGGEWTESTELPVKIRVSHADGKKCCRCWNYTSDVGSSSAHPELCNRCITHLNQEITKND